jgi:formylglycine-generating enzyme required for sulfatase activity
MAEQEIFKGFFSYARDDGETDPLLITALTTELERRVNARLVNAQFAVWRDTERLRVGERWDDAIGGELRRADVLIVLLTPRWIGSEYCRKEFTMFEELDASRRVEQCVVPILARPIAQQEKRLTPEQRDIFGRINQRQHYQVLAVDFLRMSRARRNAEIDKLAEHIARIIGQLSDLPRPARSTLAAVSPIGRGAEPAGAEWARAPSRRRAETAERVEEGARRAPAAGGADADRADLEVFRDASFAPELVVLTAGEFVMGSPEGEEGSFGNEGPQHRVRIGQRFAVGRYPVTFDEFDRFCAANQLHKASDEGWGRGRRPVINVSWQDAQAYIAWLSQETGRAYRLPSEAEWEYTCRAGTTSRYSFGDVVTPDRANYGASRLGRTSEVGVYPANPWGLHDMQGNVWEWVEDDWHDDYRGAPSDGSAWKDPETSSKLRLCVLRGSSWSGSSRGCWSAFRGWRGSGGRLSDVGFRVARTLS